MSMHEPLSVKCEQKLRMQDFVVVLYATVDAPCPEPWLPFVCSQVSLFFGLRSSCGQVLRVPNICGVRSWCGVDDLLNPGQPQVISMHYARPSVCDYVFFGTEEQTHTEHQASWLQRRMWRLITHDDLQKLTICDGSR